MDKRPSKERLENCLTHLQIVCRFHKTFPPYEDCPAECGYREECLEELAELRRLVREREGEGRALLLLKMETKE